MAPKYRAMRVGWITPHGLIHSQLIAIDEEFEFDGVPGSWMLPLNDAARARTDATRNEGRYRFLRPTYGASTSNMVVREVPPLRGQGRSGL